MVYFLKAMFIFSDNASNVFSTRRRVRSAGKHNMLQNVVGTRSTSVECSHKLLGQTAVTFVCGH